MVKLVSWGEQHDLYCAKKQQSESDVLTFILNLPVLFASVTHQSVIYKALPCVCISCQFPLDTKW